MGSKRPAVWSPEARDDLAYIWKYYSEVAGRYTADNIVRNINAAVHMIQDFPLIGRSRDKLRQGLRSVVARPYVVFYSMRKEIPEVVRVLDARRDVDDIFSGGAKS